MASDVPLAPDFINFLFSKKPKFDAYFVVGNKSQEEPERIGAVKLMLMAHSEVFQLQLEESELKEKGDIPVEDVHPSTFKLMLKYVYGYDTTSDLCFDDADNMLYVAEKYMMKTLKNKLAGRLMKLLNPDNLCSLLNNPACYTHLELDSAITEILRYETDHVLASPQFLWVNTEGFLKILEQDGLAVPEIELWRAAIKWAKHRADPEDSELLRQQISSLTRHLRIYAMTEVDIVEVISSDILTKDEVKAVTHFFGKKEKTESLNVFSDETEPRKRLQSKTKHDLFAPKVSTIPYSTYSLSVSRNEYEFILLTKNYSIELLPFVCLSHCRERKNPKNWICRIECATTITEVANPDDPESSASIDPPVTVFFNEKVKFGEKFEVPLSVGGKNITLRPDTKYSITIKVNGKHLVFYSEKDICSVDKYENDHLVFMMESCCSGMFCHPFDTFYYRIIEKYDVV